MAGFAGFAENITPTTWDPYSDYYSGNHEDSSPCEFGELWSFGKVFLPTFYSVVFILGFIGNSLVVCVLVIYRNQINLTDICLFNLALSDILFVLTLPFYAHSSRVGQWTFGSFMCAFISGLHSTGFFCSTFFMVVMSIDRYIAIIYAHKMLRYRTSRAGVALSMAVWMLSLGVSLPVFMFTKVNGSQEVMCYYDPEMDAWKHYNIFTTNILGLLIPFLVMIGCYSRIIPILMKMKTTKKHRVVKLIISIMVVFFVFWTPYNISLFLKFLKSVLPGDVCEVEENVRLAVTVTETLAYTHCCLNPIIYAFVGQKFMRRVLQLLKKCVPWISLSSTWNDPDSSFRNSTRSSEVVSTLVK
ncbi:CX3C chemokine receptor 1-like [Cheilinus undulatus]|uniref:CX3C chemokine receptor 1-like n=1 Tax=Cheilinus undulatus TaxID=241271 RepID=UPI001BD39DC0|nr:CX3C chemokine receptor 1-like [Cheilinus undulatus]